MLQELTNFLATDIRTAVPILLCALGLVFSSKAGVVNIGAEGMMLTGALMGVVGSYYFGNVWLGALLAMISSLLVALIFAYFTITVGADQTVVGTAINMLGLGLTSTLDRVIFGLSTAPPQIAAFDPVAIPVLSKIPVLGPALFSQSIPVYLAFLCVPAAWYVMYKTDLGLSIRGVGEHPRACATVGLSVRKVRYGTVLFSGLLAGFAGTFVSLGTLSFFTENMVSGRGFMAVAAVVFGNYNPVGVLGAALVFGAGEGVMYRLQAAGSVIPFQFLLMVPYVLTILTLCGFVGKSQVPAASGEPYRD